MKSIIKIIIFFLIIPLKASPIVSATWLSQNLCKENIKLIEVGSSYNSYLVEHIKCAQYTNFYVHGWRESKKKVPMNLVVFINVIIIQGESLSSYLDLDS